MSNTNEVFATISTNQDLFIELNDANAETVSGGYEVFTVRNETKYDIDYFVDGTKTKAKFAKPGTGSVWTAYKGGIIEFDVDGRDHYTELKKYDLSDGGVYAFRENTSTPSNPYDIELYSIG